MKTARSLLVIIERIAVIIGAIMGVVAFFWQVTDKIESKKEKVSIVDYGDVEESENPYSFSISIANLGERQIYLKSAYLIVYTSDNKVSFFYSLD